MRANFYLTLTGPPVWKEPEEGLPIGELILFPATGQVQVDGEIRRLTSKQFRLLQFLALHAGQTLTHEMLFRYLWSEKKVGDPTSKLPETIRGLRAKIETDPAHPKRLLSVYGEGYRLEK